MLCPVCGQDNTLGSYRCFNCRNSLEAESQVAQPKPKDATDRAKQQQNKSAVGLVTSIAGIAVGWYVGVHILLPALSAGAIWLLGNYVLKPSYPGYLPALSTQAGHMLWLGLGSVLLGSWDAAFIDIFILAVGLLWLWIKPSAWPLVILCLYQLTSLGVNIHALISQPVGSLQHKALVVHISLRALAIFYMWRGFQSARLHVKNTS